MCLSTGVELARKSLGERMAEEEKQVSLFPLLSPFLLISTVKLFSSPRLIARPPGDSPRRWTSSTSRLALPHNTSSAPQFCSPAMAQCVTKATLTEYGYTTIQGTPIVSTKTEVRLPFLLLLLSERPRRQTNAWSFPSCVDR